MTFSLPVLKCPLDDFLVFLTPNTAGNHGGQMVALQSGQASGDPSEIPPYAYGAATAEEDHAPSGGHIRYRTRPHTGGCKPAVVGNHFRRPPCI